MADNITEILLKKIVESADETKSDIRDIKEKLNSLDLTSKEHKLILDDHIRRTEQNEELIQSHRHMQESLANRIVPLERNTAMWAGAAKVFTILAAIISLAAAVWKVAAAL